MSERLSMMPGYCTEHDLRFDRLGCPICVMDKFDDPRPTLSPEAQAVLEAAEALRADWRRCGMAEDPTPCAQALTVAVDAYEATQRPKDYAPGDLPPGTRFRFATASPSGPALIIGSDTLGRYYINAEEKRRSNFCSEDRIIPLPEQDG